MDVRTRKTSIKVQRREDMPAFSARTGLGKGQGLR
jgi:hypothetical protein